METPPIVCQTSELNQPNNRLRSSGIWLNMLAPTPTFAHGENQVARTRSKCYGMDCFGAYTLHMSKPNVTRVQSATEWTASVHTLHMSNLM